MYNYTSGYMFLLNNEVIAALLLDRLCTLCRGLFQVFQEYIPQPGLEPRCELRILRFSECNRCYIGRHGCRERDCFRKTVFFSGQLCNLACRCLIGWWGTISRQECIRQTTLNCNIKRTIGPILQWLFHWGRTEAARQYGLEPAKGSCSRGNTFPKCLVNPAVLGNCSPKVDVMMHVVECSFTQCDVGWAVRLTRRWLV